MITGSEARIDSRPVYGHYKRRGRTVYTCDQHDRAVVVFEKGNCPLCSAIDEKTDLENELAKAKDRIDELEARDDE